MNKSAAATSLSDIVTIYRNYLEFLKHRCPQYQEAIRKNEQPVNSKPSWILVYTKGGSRSSGNAVRPLRFDKPYKNG